MTLEKILESREARVRRQRELLEVNPGLSLLCLTVQLPGPVKRNRSSLVVAEAGVRAVREAFRVEFEELRDLETGYEGFFLVAMSPVEAKRLACQIEDSHPLGRLMDLDVIVVAGQPLEPGRVHSRFALRQAQDGAAAEYGLSSTAAPAEVIPQPIGRGDLGLEPRRCLLCGNEVRHCMRAKTHTTEELLAKIDQMVDNYLNL